MQIIPQQSQQIHLKHQQCLDAFWDGLCPDPQLDVDEWADKHRWLSERESPEHGQWRTSRVPYSRRPMKCLSPSHPAREVVLVWGAQLCKTEIGNNFTGHNIDYAPGPQLIVMPTVDTGKRYSRQRLSQMIANCPRLRDKVVESKSRDSGNTTLSKEFPGGIVVVAGANSAAGLRSMPCRYAMIDEYDAYPEDCEGEGDPGELIVARTSNFTRRKLLYASTPTFEGRSRIYQKFYEGTQEYFYVPCPHCKKKQILKFVNIKWLDDNNPDSAKYMCEHCAVLIEPLYKTWMLENGEWIPHNPAASGYTVSFQLSSLYSPKGWLSWADIVRRWVAAQKNPNKLRTFVNTVLAETWKEKGEAPEWKKLYDRRLPYKQNTIPDARILFLTAAVDVQGDRLEVEIVGWDKLKRSWSIDYRQIMGNPEDKTETGPWFEIDKLFNEKWIHPNGLAMGAVRIGIDESYKTQVVREYIRRKSPLVAMSMRGFDNSQILLGTPKLADVGAAGKKVKRGVKYWPVGTSLAKSELYGWLNQESPTQESGQDYPAGYCFFPEYREEYFKGITAEQIVVRIVKGYRRYMWEKTYERNEPLDLRNYNRAAAAAFGMDRFTDAKWAELEGAVAKVAKTGQNDGGPDSPAASGGIARRPGNFLKRNRDER